MPAYDLKKLNRVIVAWHGLDGPERERFDTQDHLVMDQVAQSLQPMISFPAHVFSTYHGTTRTAADRLIAILSAAGQVNRAFNRNLEAQTVSFTNEARVQGVDTCLSTAVNQGAGAAVLYADPLMAYAYANRLARVKDMGWQLDGAKGILDGAIRIPEWGAAYFCIGDRTVELLERVRV